MINYSKKQFDHLLRALIQTFELGVGLMATPVTNSEVPSPPAPLPLNVEAPVDETPQDRFVLEGFKQCSKSHLWKLMMSFYDRKGMYGL